MIKGIIFDLDGTTLSTLCDIQGSLNIVLENHGYLKKNYDEVRLAIGKGSRNLIKDCLPLNTKDEIIDTLLNEYIEIYGHHYDVETRPYEGIKELFNELEEKGIVLAINSNKPDKYTKNLIKSHYPGNNFIAVIGAREGIPYKPDPYSANEIIKKMGLLKEEVIYVGDSESDIQTGHNAHLKVVGCSYGFRDKQTLMNNNADIIIDTPLDLLKVL